VIPGILGPPGVFACKIPGFLAIKLPNPAPYPGNEGLTITPPLAAGVGFTVVAGLVGGGGAGCIVDDGGGLLTVVDGLTLTVFGTVVLTNVSPN